MTDRRVILVSVIVATLSGLGLLATARQADAEPWELVRWKTLADVGNAPYPRPLLIEFTADWCLPCYRMRITTFRDPDFVSVLKQYDLEPVRVEDNAKHSLVVRDLMKRFRVSGVPTFVVVGRDGRSLTVSEGQVDTETFRYQLSCAYQRVERGLYWIPATTAEGMDASKVVIKSFDRWFLIDSGSRQDWRWSKDPGFVHWANTNLTLVEDQFDRHMAGVAYYRRHHIRAIPTVLAFDPAGNELLRFEGEDAVAAAPLRIAAVAREHGFAVPDPPASGDMPGSTPHPRWRVIVREAD